MANKKSVCASDEKLLSSFLKENEKDGIRVFVAGGSRGGVDAYHVFVRHSLQAERIGVAQVVFVTERECFEVSEGSYFGGIHAGIAIQLFVEAGVVCGVVKCRLEL